MKKIFLKEIAENITTVLKFLSFLNSYQKQMNWARKKKPPTLEYKGIDFLESDNFL